MANKFWDRLYKLSIDTKPKVKYFGRGKCEKIAKEKGFDISWDYFGKNKHKVEPDNLGEGIAYNTNEVMNRMLN